MSFRCGARRSDAAKMARMRNAMAHPRIAAQLQRTASPHPMGRPVRLLPSIRLDQGQSSACTAHAKAIGNYLVLAAAGNSIPWIPSQRHNYALSGALERLIAAPFGDPPKLQDNGRQLADAVLADTLGIVPMSPAMSPDGRASDIWSPEDVAALAGAPPATNTEEPRVVWLESAIADRLSGAHAIDLTSAALPSVTMAALDAGMPIFVGFPLSSNGPYQNATPSTVVAPELSGDEGHAVLIVDYRLNAINSVDLLTLSSWGPNFCDNGMAWCSLPWLAQAWEAIVLDETLIGGGAA